MPRPPQCSLPESAILIVCYVCGTLCSCTGYSLEGGQPWSPSAAKQEATLAAEGASCFSSQSPAMPAAALPALESLGPSCHQLCWGTASDRCLSDTPPQACLKPCWGKNQARPHSRGVWGGSADSLARRRAWSSSGGHQRNLGSAFLLLCMAHKAGEISTP